ncbi:hypothetical protein ALC56_12822 [Trachymyrmex septentrionalis]|uniref:Uncharacterized protein n=1 Tax=Trachymyrmex septentrionalis TaxID=34720 RepID=A0A195EYA4_9HYME|nr:hypothetical protein ALC56_12822 [Trachymyrmex septentrionalis]
MLNTAIVPSPCLCDDDGGYESARGLFRSLIDAAPQQTGAPKLLRLREQAALIKFNVDCVYRRNPRCDDDGKLRSPAQNYPSKTPTDHSGIICSSPRNVSSRRFPMQCQRMQFNR